MLHVWSPALLRLYAVPYCWLQWLQICSLPGGGRTVPKGGSSVLTYVTDLQASDAAATAQEGGAVCSDHTYTSPDDYFKVIFQQ
jgi:hypothetical protein